MTARRGSERGGQVLDDGRPGGLRPDAHHVEPDLTPYVGMRGQP